MGGRVRWGLETERKVTDDVESDVRRNAHIDELLDHQRPREVEIEAVGIHKVPIVFKLLEKAVLDHPLPRTGSNLTLAGDSSWLKYTPE